MHNFTIYVFFLLLSTYMFRLSRHLQGADMISLKHTAVNSLNQHSFVVMSIVQGLVKLCIKYCC
jgi:hypothetical protein